LNYFSTAVPFGVIKELMCSEGRGRVQGTNFFIRELILVREKEVKENHRTRRYKLFMLQQNRAVFHLE